MSRMLLTLSVIKGKTGNIITPAKIPTSLNLWTTLNLLLGEQTFGSIILERLSYGVVIDIFIITSLINKHFQITVLIFFILPLLMGICLLAKSYYTKKV